MDSIRVENIKKSYGEVEVLKDISFSVKEGEVVAIIGPSGGGKSTILRCITQLEDVKSGKISICGKTLVDGVYSDEKERRRIMLSVGLVFQNFNLFPHFSVLKNITEAQERVLGISKKESIKIAEKLLERMGLEDKKNAYPGELSGGQQQRVSIARSLALKPKILCFDEPTSALDPELTGDILKVIKDLANDDMTMIVVTHEMLFAKDVADRIIFMDGGIIVEEGSAKELIESPKNERTKAFLSNY